jgi:hypothetical protein
MNSSEKWLRLDERINALDNLRMCAHFLRTLDEPIRWKWAIVALHQALYGYAIAAVQGSDACSVLKKPSDPTSDLISIWEALKRAKDPGYLWPGSAPLVTTAQEDEAVERLVGEFRNSFEHFVPAGWSIEVSGFPTILGHTLRVLEAIAVGSGSVRYYEPDEEEAVKDAIREVRQALQGRHRCLTAAWSWQRAAQRMGVR